MYRNSCSVAPVRTRSSCCRSSTEPLMPNSKSNAAKMMTFELRFIARPVRVGAALQARPTVRSFQAPPLKDQRGAGNDGDRVHERISRVVNHELPRHSLAMCDLIDDVERGEVRHHI